MGGILLGAALGALLWAGLIVAGLELYNAIGGL